MKTLIEIDRNVWGRVKHLATVKEITLNSAVELLLVHGLSHQLAHKQRGTKSTKLYKLGKKGKALDHVVRKHPARCAIPVK